MIDEIDEEQVILGEKETTIKKSSDYNTEKQIYQQNNVQTYLSGDIFPLKGDFTFLISWSTLSAKFDIFLMLTQIYLY